MKEIDYSELPQEKVHDLSEDWEPPVHKFFGKKLPNGKMEKEPVYTHIEYPRMVYSEKNDRIVAKIVHSDAELMSLGDGWKKNPAEFGVITQPSWEQMQMLKKAQEEKAEDVAARTDVSDYKIPKMTKTALKALE
jgi:hypothetical protein